MVTMVVHVVINGIVYVLNRRIKTLKNDRKKRLHLTEQSTTRLVVGPTYPL